MGFVFKFLLLPFAIQTNTFFLRFLFPLCCFGCWLWPIGVAVVCLGVAFTVVRGTGFYCCIGGIVGNAAVCDF